MNDTEKRIIVIGSEGHYGVKTTAWSAKEMPNIADYDNVILDTSSLASLLEKKVVIDKNIPEEQLQKFINRINKNLEYVKDRLINILHSEGNIYVICSPIAGVKYGTTTWGFINNYDWIPLPIGLVKEEGETIEIVDDEFAHYFQFVKKWSFCFEERVSVTSELANFYQNKYYPIPKAEVIAKNRYEKPLALALSYDLHRFKHKVLIELDQRISPGAKTYENEVAATSGKIILLPSPTEIDVREAINILLEDFGGIQQKTLPPEGIETILVPGESLLKQQIKEKLDKIEGLESEISDLETHEGEKTEFKQLLYETGDPLEDICKLTLSQLGCKIDDSVEDFSLITTDKEAIVEVKGRERSILREDGAMLAQNRSNYAIQKGKGIREIKAILLGNPWRLVLPLEERAKKEPFSSHLVEDANVEDMALVTTVELFKAYCEFLEGNISSDEILERLFSGIGQTKLVGE